MHKKILNYTVVSLLGEGGMSRVYLGEDSISRQRVAIKELFPHLAQSEDLRNRFRREAQIMASLDHPNIVRLIRYEEGEQGMFLIMEYADGINLEQHIKNVTGPISETKSIELMKTILGAFSYAHSKGIVHRDIKPSNIVITKDGVVKILDFGIAKILDDTSSPYNRTRTGTRLGTVSYMSPEQVKALPDIDARSDIYSLGVVLHQMVTGADPYGATESDFDIQTKIVSEPLRRANEIYPFVSDKIQWVIDKATSKNRDSRFSSCDEFIAAFGNVEAFDRSSHDTIIDDTYGPANEFTSANTKREKTILGVIIGFVILFIIIMAIVLSNDSSGYEPATEYPAEEVVAADSTAVYVDDTMAVPEAESAVYEDDSEISSITYYSPSYESRTSRFVTIQSIQLTSSETIVKFRVENNGSQPIDCWTGAPGNSTAYYILADGGRYDLVSLSNIDTGGTDKLAVGYYLDFEAHFSSIPFYVSKIDIIEGVNNIWGFKGVNLQQNSADTAAPVAE